MRKFYSLYKIIPEVRTYLTQWLEYCFHTAVVIGSNPIVGRLNLSKSWCLFRLDSGVDSNLIIELATLLALVLSNKRIHYYLRAGFARPTP